MILQSITSCGCGLASKGAAMKSLVALVSLVAMSFGVLSPQATARDMELSSLQNFQVVEVTRDRELRISGENLESAWPMRSIKIKRKRNDVFVRVKFGWPFGDKPERPLNDLIPIDSTVEHVYFGKKKALIWQRSF